MGGGLDDQTIACPPQQGYAKGQETHIVYRTYQGNVNHPFALSATAKLSSHPIVLGSPVNQQSSWLESSLLYQHQHVTSSLLITFIDVLMH